ncbi:MAG: RNA-binding S4 domain-containing protein [Bacillota bacterium]|jgi:ribosome-associated protein
MKVAIQSPYITLGQFLKLVNLVQSGGQAKAFVVGNQIQVNGVLTRQRGKKIYPGDKVEVSGTVYEITG